MKGINNLLKAVYARNWEELVNYLKKEEIDLDTISSPLLIKAFQEYEDAKYKIMFIGQQTNGWHSSFKELLNEKNPVDSLLDTYDGFHLGKDYFSPFWYACYNLFYRCNPRGPNYSFTWSNVLKVDQKNKRPNKKIVEILRNTFPVLKDEIQILKPDVVVFFTGPNYDDDIEGLLGKIELVEFHDLPIREVAKIKNNHLPEKSYRLYHPNYMVRSRKDLVNDIEIFRLLEEDVVKV